MKAMCSRDRLIQRFKQKEQPESRPDNEKPDRSARPVVHPFVSVMFVEDSRQPLGLA
jgi:hypothetical protein